MLCTYHHSLKCNYSLSGFFVCVFFKLKEKKKKSKDVPRVKGGDKKDSFA